MEDLPRIDYVSEKFFTKKIKSQIDNINMLSIGKTV